MVPGLMAFIDIGDLITLVVFVLIALGWISNLITGKQQPQKPPMMGGPPRRPAPPRDDRIKSEIEIFLEQVGGQKRPQPSPQAPRQETMHRPPAETRPAKPTRQIGDAPKPTVRVLRPEAPVKPAGAATSPADPVARRERPGESLAKRGRPGSETLGTEVAAHLAEHMKSGRLATRTGERLPHLTSTVADQAQPPSGTSAASLAPALGASVIAMHPKNIVELLRNREGVRQAILINEILSQPLARRGRRKLI
jgi:hypothetical protein